MSAPSWTRPRSSRRCTRAFSIHPALALPAKDTLNLRLSVPPSFKDPKVGGGGGVAPVGATRPPPLHPVNLAESYLRSETGPGAAAEGAPLVFATNSPTASPCIL